MWFCAYCYHASAEHIYKGSALCELCLRKQKGTAVTEPEEDSP